MTRAFSLIEALIAVALGMVIATAAWSALRVASQSMQSARRLAMTNELIAVGVQRAFAELDGWEAYDARFGAADGRRLRASSTPPVATGGGRPLTLGLPFAPFARTVDGFAPTWPATAYGRGWQDDERLWAVSADNELTWWTGNKAESQETDCRFGHYAIFGLSRLPAESAIAIDGGTSGAVGGWQPRNGGGVYGVVDFGPEPTPPAANAPVAAYRHEAPGWLYNQIRGLGDALGWYGMIDYLPANAIVCYASRFQRMVGTTNWSASPGDATDAAGRPIYMIKTFAKANAAWQFPDKPWFVLQSFSPNWVPHGVDFLTSYSAYGLVPVNGNQRDRIAPAMTTDELTFHHRSVARMESTDMPIGTWAANVSNDFLEPGYPDAADRVGSPALDDFMRRTTSASTLVPLRPTHWPEVSVSVARYLRLCRFSTQLAVGWTDPVSGGRADLRFTALGTTLRGARRQRGLDR
ncbi:MAG TPA: hypothetical protein VEL07_02555 [Planctomycetota bacterium]|nr:hypothetical protein [Planctomycetota bacterium]